MAMCWICRNSAKVMYSMLVKATKREATETLGMFAVSFINRVKFECSEIGYQFIVKKGYVFF